MGCHFPRPVWRRPDGRGFTFRAAEGVNGPRAHTVPCGQCIGCRLDWAGDWAARCEKEARLWPVNSFVTLTYDESNLPLGGHTRSTVSVREFQLFMKRLRKARFDRVRNPETNRVRKVYRTIRFFGSGEYGSKNGRAHYHALLFNCDFPDKRLWKSTPAGNLYVSDELARLWPFGFSSIGSVTFNSASYVARYVLKKASDNPSDYLDRDPPFVLMSRKPGVGAAWFDRYMDDCVSVGGLIVGEGKRRRLPRYFAERMRLRAFPRWFDLKWDLCTKGPVSKAPTSSVLFSRWLNSTRALSELARPV